VTRAEAIRVEVHRVAEAAVANQPHLAHIRHLAVHRLRNAHEDHPQFDTTFDDERAGERMFGAVTTVRAELPAAA
jgi:hypothetical protein